MDDTHFDGLTKAFSIPSRRGIFAGAATAALASLAAIVAKGGPDTTRAAKRKKKKSGAKSSPGPAGPPGPQGPQGPAGPVRIAYAQVSPTPNSKPHVMNENVIDIALFDDPSSATGRVYCFKLAFQPTVAAGSSFITNNAVAATVIPPNDFLLRCP